MGMEKSLYPVSSHQALIYLKAFIVLLLSLAFFRFNNLSFFILPLLHTWCCFSRPLIIFTAFFQALSNYFTLALVLWCEHLFTRALQAGAEVYFESYHLILQPLSPLPYDAMLL